MTKCCLLAAAFAACAAGATLDGRVVEDHSNLPLASAELRVLRLNGRAMLADLETDSEGRFHVPDLLEGEYRLQVSKALHVAAEVRVRAAADSLPVTVRLVRCGIIAGQVVDDEARPLRGAYVWVMLKPPGGAAFETHGNPVPVDESGHYRIFNLPPGQYALAASYSAAASGVLFYPNNTEPRIFTISGGEEYSDTDFTVTAEPRYHVSGTVALPKPGVVTSLTLVAADQPALAAARVRADRDGRFHFEGIASGSYLLLASAPVQGYGGLSVSLGPERLFGRAPVQVAGQDVDGISIALREARAATFILRPVESCPESAVLSLSPVEDWGAWLMETAQLTQGKESAVKGLAPGKYEVKLSPSTDACYSGSDGMVIDASADTRPITLRMAPAGSIRGRVLAPAEQPSKFAVVLLSADDDKAPAQIAYPDAKGEFAFPTLRPGRYRIAARPSGSARWVTDLARMVEINVPGGTPTEVELPAPAGGEK